MVMLFYKERDRSAAHVVSRWPFTAEVRFLSTSVSAGIVVDKVVLRWYLDTFFFPPECFGITLSGSF